MEIHEDTHECIKCFLTLTFVFILTLKTNFITLMFYNFPVYLYINIKQVFLHTILSQTHYLLRIDPINISLFYKNTS